jgi:KDO2-lipid IV(A) lauroyltransferase
MTDYFIFRFSTLFLRILAVLPLKVLYFFSGIIYFFVNHIFSYRKNIVIDNLSRSFPEYSKNEITQLSKKFYRYFSVNLIESIKMFGASEQWFKKHIKFKNPELLEKLYQEGKSVMAMGAHYGNWEWILGLSGSVKHIPLAIYKPLNNRYFDSFFKNHREKFGTELVSMRESVRVLPQYKQEGKLVFTLTIADQSPVWEEIQYWTYFLNQQTAVYIGPEKLARKTQAAVVFLKFNVLSKGFYEVELVPVSMEPHKEEPYAVTEKFTKLLENTIREKPEYWLWTHRRWKLTRKREEQEARGLFRFEGNVQKNH